MSVAEEEEDQGIVDFFATFQNPTVGGASPADGADTGNSVSPISPSSPAASTGSQANAASFSASATIPRDDAPYPHCPLYIPSRGRADQERGTMATLVRDLVPFTLVVEPEEGEAYRQMLDHLVFNYFGAAGMSFARAPQETNAGEDEMREGGGSNPSEAKKGEGEASHGASASVKKEATHGAAGVDMALVRQPCLCCRACTHETEREADKAMTAEHVNAMAQFLARRAAISKLYHHGYVFTPFHTEPAAMAGATGSGGDGAPSPHLKKEEEQDEKGAGSALKEKEEGGKGSSPWGSQRMPAAAYCLTTVEEVRSLFRVVELPVGQQGVSFARNFILQVLVPSDMVAGQVDRTGHVDELELFGPSAGHHPTTTSAPVSGAAQAGGTGVAAVSSKAYLGEEQLRAAQAQACCLSTSSAEMEASPATVLKPDSPAEVGRLAPHSLYGYYWVMDDDIYNFFHAQADSGSTTPAPDGAIKEGSSDHSSSPSSPGTRKNVRVSAREMMRQVSLRVEQLKRVYSAVHGGGDPNAAQGTSVDTSLPQQQQQQQTLLSSFTPQAQKWTSVGGAPFTCKEDCIRNNLQPVRRPTAAAGAAAAATAAGAAKSTALNTENYAFLPLTACISLEYSRFAFTYDDSALAVNSYNNIACLFNYALLHAPREVPYFPRNTPGIRPVSEVLGCGLAFSRISLNQPKLEELRATAVEAAGALQAQQQQQDNALSDSIVAKLTNRGSSARMLWYKFTVREDYDFTLQLIARGMYTLRFRNLSFDVPQMAKVRGGMTDFYKTGGDDIRWQNELFVRQWPAVAIPWVKGKNSTERDDIKVRWDLLHPSRARFPGAFLYLAHQLPQIQSQQPQQQQAPVSSFRAVAAPPPLPSLAPAGTVASPRGPSAREEAPPPHQQPQHRTASGTQIKWKGKPHWGSESDSDDDDDDEEDSVTSSETSSDADSETASGDEANAGPVTGAMAQNAGEPETKRVRTEALKPPPPLPPAAPVDSATLAGRHGWKGYAVERWRELTVPEAASLGLELVNPAELHVGMTVAAVPPSFAHNPSCVLATLVEKNRDPTTGETDWTAAAQRARGVPLLSLSPRQIYKVPQQPVAEVAAAVDAFFATWRRPPSTGGEAALTAAHTESEASSSHGNAGNAAGRGAPSSWLDG